jgi:subtilisin family serine protease
MTGLSPAPSDHGTAVASLLVGSGSVRGALPAADLLAINVFAPDSQGLDSQGRLGSRTDWCLKGLNALALAEPRPDVVNLSFGGGESRLLGLAIRKLYQQGIILVAAAGNGGRDSPVAFPASREEVIAVTALDAKKRIYSQAPTSASVSLAAPGVDVWAAGLKGQGRYMTGTSFAAPWVTALVALVRARGQTVDDILTGAEDLGLPGADPVFGAGMAKKPDFD